MVTPRMPNPERGSWHSWWHGKRHDFSVIHVVDFSANSKATAKRREEYRLLFRVLPDFLQADAGEFESEERGRGK